MPIETARKMRKKRITNPDNSSQYVDVPVIEEITFIDATERGQEYRFTFNNEEGGEREVHVDTVVDPQNQAHSIKVERIDKFTVHDLIERGQETQYSPDNVTGGDTIPPHFVSHQKTHVKRITNGSYYIDTERIDEIWFTDNTDRAQETKFTLNGDEAWDVEE